MEAQTEPQVEFDLPKFAARMQEISNRMMSVDRDNIEELRAFANEMESFMDEADDLLWNVFTHTGDLIACTGE